MKLLAASGEGFKNWTDGIASIGTALAIVVGAVWAFLRLRDTPESRYKFLINVTVQWITRDGAV